MNSPANLLRSGLPLLDVINVGTLVIEGDSILFANAAFVKVVGMSLAALQAKPLAELAGAAWVDFSLGNSWADALPWPMPDDSVRWFEVSLEKSSLDGREVGIATCIDVTSRMRAEGAEANMLQMITEIIESNPVACFVLDASHEVTHWNRACEQLTGASAMEMVGRADPWRVFLAEERPLLANMVMSPDAREQFAHFYPGQSLPESGSADTLQAESWFPGRNAEGHWMQIAASPLRDAAGTIVGAIETLVDISARKRAEEALRQANAQAETLVEERTRELSAATAELEEDIRRRQQIEQELQQRLQEVTALNIQLSDAQERLMQSQQQLLQNEKLASIGQLAAGVAHEINNPIGYVFSNIGTLQGYLDDLLRLLDLSIEASGQLPDAGLREAIASLSREIDLAYLKTDIRDLMSESREGIERVRKIVQDLKDFSHADASSDWQWADLQRGLESTLNIVNNELKYRADVVRDFTPLPRVQCIPSQLNQVFMNLLVNAAHAMKDGQRGTITVRTRLAGEEVSVVIEDNGCGMTEEVRQRIFDPFFTTKPVGKGTGLGLSLSFGIVRKHHGRIEVSSTPGAGTCFMVHLPLQQPEEVAQ